MQNGSCLNGLVYLHVMCAPGTNDNHYDQWRGVRTALRMKSESASSALSDAAGLGKFNQRAFEQMRVPAWSECFARVHRAP